MPPLTLRGADPLTDWRQIILSRSHLVSAHPAAAEIRSPSAMKTYLCVCASQSLSLSLAVACDTTPHACPIALDTETVILDVTPPGPSARQEMGPPCLMPWQPDRKKQKGPTLGAFLCICV